MRITILLILFLAFMLMSIQRPIATYTNQSPHKILTVMSYNVENLFDTINNELTRDDEFTPEGSKHWNSSKYFRKLQYISEAISQTGGIYWPSIIGLIEIENSSVIEDLLSRTCLKDKGYKFSITHSHDPRGINVGLLYREKDFKLEYEKEHQILFTEAPNKRSRNILEVALRLNNGHLLHILVAHWPSRRSGINHSEPLRLDAAVKMRQICDSLYSNLEKQERRKTHFILMGDFNEEAHERAISKGLKAQIHLPKKRISELSDSLNLYSLMHPKLRNGQYNQPLGSYCYKGIWNQLDHFIISESLLLEDNSLKYQIGSAINFFMPNLGSKHQYGHYPSPYRTYGGEYYLGGYSDHYPIKLNLIID